MAVTATAEAAGAVDMAATGAEDTVPTGVVAAVTVALVAVVVVVVVAADPPGVTAGGDLGLTGEWGGLAAPGGRLGAVVGRVQPSMVQLRREQEGGW